MKMGSMLGDVLRSFFKKPVTQPYPFERRPAPKNFRGKLIWEPEKCTGCQLCVKDCPSYALDFIVLDKINKRFVLRYYADRCTYCAQCVENCRFRCVGMSNEEWEMASTSKDPFIVYYGREEDVKAVLARIAQESMEAPHRE